MSVNTSQPIVSHSPKNNSKQCSATNVLSVDIPGEDFEYSCLSCYLCNGYYGPCFGEPVCATCHAFVFPEDLYYTVAVAVLSEKTDDGDSGNDEPTDLYYAVDRRLSQQQLPHPPPAPSAASGEEPAVAAAPLQQVVPLPPPPPPPPPRPTPLARRLEILSTPSEPFDLRMSPGVLERLPPEVLLAVFSYLDDMSLWSVGNACKRWAHLVQTHVSNEQWRQYTMQRWPLFKPLFIVQNWFKVYSKLTESCACKLCLQHMALQLQPPGEENSWRRNRLRNELKSLRTDPPEGIEAIPLDQKCCHWQATITGPVGSPYEGGLFYLYLQVPYSYPMCPPVVRFLTKIFHPNVSRHGDVGIDSIQHNWSLALTISKVLISVQSLLTDPYCQVCMEPSVGELYMNNREAFENVARAWTWRYAMHDAIIPQ
ncbi:uncharacterized protein LOC126190881 [Schistocerca cancellata]|uniref:uncharacterized protein LOC126190881 n=1 Tax=Schistocerca cancellata TaxID=274614 RepID=UPI0021193D4A|nr:uncharacterized protein LOC126190881 [Schistocerca cancellata]